MKLNLFHYRAYVSAVNNDCSLTADVDLGFSVVLHDVRLRLHRVRVRAGSERGGAKLAAARDLLRRLLLRRSVTIESVRYSASLSDGYAAEVWVEEKSGRRVSVNDLLVEKGLATYISFR